jgi:hypothetical protein
MELQVPGRILSADEDETGTSPGLEDLGWNVIVRDEGTCDTLGNGRPNRRFIAGDTSAQSPAPTVSHEEEGAGWGWLWLVAVALVLAIGRVVHLRFLKRAGG